MFTILCSRRLCVIFCFLGCVVLFGVRSTFPRVMSFAFATSASLSVLLRPAFRLFMSSFPTLETRALEFLAIPHNHDIFSIIRTVSAFLVFFVTAQRCFEFRKQHLLVLLNHDCREGFKTTWQSLKNHCYQQCVAHSFVCVP